MRRISTIFILSWFSLLSYSQIIADHTVVDKFDDIPQYYIDEVKKIWLTVPGESHSYAYRYGLTALESTYPAYSVSVIESGTPQAYTTSNLRASRATWGDLNNSSGWIYSYGEEDWFISLTAKSRTKAGIIYCNINNLVIGAMGFGWCWDPAIIDMTDYLNATQEYIDYCTSNSYPTKVFFTTGPVDGENATGETGYNKYLAYEAIRAYADLGPDRIFFDYADILCYNDDGSTNFTTWDGHTYPIITTTNLGDGSIGHISPAGALRLAKAIWWMLARIAGWDGGNTYVWEGDADNNFANSANWSGGLIPPDNSDIAFAANAGNHCLLDQNRTLRNITNTQADRRLVVNGRQLTITGNLNFTGGAQLDASSAASAVVFYGSDAQTIPPGSFLDNIVPYLTIDNSSGVTLNGDLTVTQELVITSGSCLSVSPAYNLTVSGNIINNSGESGFILESDLTGNATLINESESVPATVELDLTGGIGLLGAKFHYIIPPVQSIYIGADSNAVKTNLGITHFNGDLLAYNETLAVINQSDGWKYFDGYPIGTTDPEPFSYLNPARGYNIFLTGDDKIKFNGFLNAEAHSFSLNHTPFNVSPGWNLVGNPYPCNYDLEGVIELSSDQIDGVDNTVYFTHDGDYFYYDVFTNIGIGWDSDIIPPMQGFFVHVTEPSTLNLPVGSKVPEAGVSLRAKGEDGIKGESLKLIRLVLKNGTLEDETVICFADNATNGFDRIYDAFKLFGNNTVKPYLYSELNSIRYAINSLQIPDSTSVIIPLTVILKNQGTYKIEMTEFINSEALKVVLKHGDFETNFLLNTSYTFTSVLGTFSNFALKISKSTTEVKDIVKEKIKTWYNDNFLYIKCSVEIPSDKGSMIIFNINGKMVYNNIVQLEPGQTIQLPLHLQTGLFFAQLITNNQKFISKIILF